MSGQKWEGVASLVSFVVGALVLFFGGPATTALAFVLILGLLGTCLGLSFMRTWPKFYRNVVLAVLMIGAAVIYFGMLLPSK